LSLNYPIDFLSHNFIRLGLTRAKSLQTVSRFPRETRRRYAALKSNAFVLTRFSGLFDKLFYNDKIINFSIDVTKIDFNRLFFHLNSSRAITGGEFKFKRPTAGECSDEIL
jgi:hypothetical protein